MMIFMIAFLSKKLRNMKSLRKALGFLVRTKMKKVLKKHLVRMKALGLNC